jgi:hypothetical protein
MYALGLQFAEKHSMSPKGGGLLFEGRHGQLVCLVHAVQLTVDA